MKRTRRAKFSTGKNLQNEVEPERGIETHKALLNDVVLQNIFKYLGYKGLKSCRQVGNATWLRNSKKAWWSRTTVVFKGCDHPADQVEDYLKETEILSNAKNYKFMYFYGGLERFWDRVGPSIKHLEIRSCCLESVDEFRKLLYAHCPNLKKLIIEVFSFLINDTTAVVKPLEWQQPQFGEQRNLKFLKIRGSPLPVSWMELLSHFPNLQGLEAIVESPNIFNAISNIRQKDPKMLKLNHIKVRTVSKRNADESFRSAFHDPNLTFETLHIDIKNCLSETVLDILDLHAKSLKELSLGGDAGDDADYPSIRLPRTPLRNVETLKISGCIFPSIIFKHFPNVTKVKLTNKEVTNYHPITEPNPRVNSCKELTLHMGENTPDSDFEFLLKAFPNVEIFETTEINNSRFSMICEHLTKLVSFNISVDSEVNDIGLLGFNPGLEADGNRKPNITDLQDLQTFFMSSKLLDAPNDGFKAFVIRNPRIIQRELNTLPHLRKFKLEQYVMTGNVEIWKDIFATYSGH